MESSRMGIAKIRGAVNSLFAGGITRFVDLFYIPAVAKFLPRHTFRYLACGVGNYFVLDWVLYFVTYNYIVGHRFFDFGVVTISPHILAMIIVFPITFLTGFWLNRYVAFESTQQRARVQVAKYALSIVGSLVISYVGLKLLVEHFGVWATPAKMISSVVTAVYSYLAARYFTFKKGRVEECANRK
ncbi:MAG: GtrA family protein [Rikenellaceae bacterium]